MVIGQPKRTNQRGHKVMNCMMEGSWKPQGPTSQPRALPVDRRCQHRRDVDRYPAPRSLVRAGRKNGRELCRHPDPLQMRPRSEEHMSELQSRENLVCRLLLEKKK